MCDGESSSRATRSRPVLAGRLRYSLWWLFAAILLCNILAWWISWQWRYAISYDFPIGALMAVPEDADGLARDVEVMLQRKGFSKSNSPEWLENRNDSGGTWMRGRSAGELVYTRIRCEDRIVSVEVFARTRVHRWSSSRATGVEMLGRGIREWLARRNRTGPSDVDK